MDLDLADLMLNWLDCETADGRQAEVLARLRADPDFRTAVAHELHILGMLQVIRTADPRWLRLEDELGWSRPRRPAAKEFADAVAAEVELLPALSTPNPKRSRPIWKRLKESRWIVAASILLLAGGFFAFSWSTSRIPTGNPAVAQAESIAILARLNGPGWDGDSGPAEGDIVKTGLLKLKSGSASIALFSGVTLHIEGPSVVELLAFNRIHCRKGKFRFDAPLEVSGFTVLSQGTSLTDPTGEFAITVEDDNVSVMVFAGQTEVSLLGRMEEVLSKEMLTSGQAVRIDAKAGTMIATSSLPSGYANAIPSLDPQLSLSADYPAAIRASRPSSYWRFEKSENGLVPNEIASGSALQLIGQAAVTGQPDANHCLNFPPQNEFDQHGALTAKGWSPKGKNYAIECWVMPRLVRHSALIGLVEESDTPMLRQYGILLELTGQPSGFRFPTRTVRALSRFPVEQVGGVNLFSPANYLPYNWRHLVLQRTGNRLELYSNGELAAVTSFTSDIPLPTFRMVLGALYARSDGSSVSDRPFVGLMDEVALYDHSLSASDIAKHHRLATTSRLPD